MIRMMLISLVAGAASVLAFAPFDIAILAFPGLAVLFYHWWRATPRAAFFAGYSFGLGMYLCGVSWVYVSLNVYGGMPLWMGVIAVFLFASLLALLVAIQGWLIAIVTAAASKTRLLLMPVMWVVFEWVKSWLFTGFPWLDLGYTQINHWLSSFAPVGGVYLVSFCVALVAVCLLALIIQRSAKKRYLVLSIVALVFITSALLKPVDWTAPSGDKLTVVLVQGNIPIEKKWQRDYRYTVIDQYAALIRDSAKLLESQQRKADLTVLPETALPLFVQQVDARFWQSLAPNDGALISGVMDHYQQQYDYNAAVLYCGNGKTQVYRKRHLVPFGEYLPLRFLFGWVIDYLQLPMSDFSSWQGSQPMHCDNGLAVSLSICYEDAFAGEMRRHLNQATVLVNISEDAWFGDSFAPHQRLQMAQMRAKELGRPLVRSANTGPSVSIDHQGRVLDQTAQFSAEALATQIQPMTGMTPYARFGNWIVWLCLTFILVLATLNLRTRSTYR